MYEYGQIDDKQQQLNKIAGAPWMRASYAFRRAFVASWPSVHKTSLRKRKRCGEGASGCSRKICASKAFDHLCTHAKQSDITLSVVYCVSVYFTTRDADEQNATLRHERAKICANVTLCRTAILSGNRLCTRCAHVAKIQFLFATRTTNTCPTLPWPQQQPPLAQYVVVSDWLAV